MYQLFKNRVILSVIGNDALIFLQNLTTNDLNSNSYSYNYLLSPQGRYLFDFFVLKFSTEQLLIDIDFSSSQLLLKKLNLYKLRSNIEINDVTSEYSILYSKEKLKITDNIIRSDQDPRFFRLGFRSLVKSPFINMLELVNDKLYAKDKYEFTIPDGIEDLIFDNSLVSHFGAEELSAISFSKGCYVGQEVISRMKYQGTARKKLFKISCGTKIAPTKIGTEITDLQGEKIGIFCSSYNNLGIALLSEEKYLGLDKKIAIIKDAQEVLISSPEWRDK